MAEVDAEAAVVDVARAVAGVVVPVAVIDAAVEAVIVVRAAVTNPSHKRGP